MAREADVHDADALSGAHQVRRLEVAVDDAALVGVVHGPGGVADGGGVVGGGELRARQRLAAHELHREVRAPARLSDLVDRDDVGMRERRGGLGFAQEALEVLGVVGVEELERDVAAEVALPRLIDRSEAAAAELAAANSRESSRACPGVSQPLSTARCSQEGSP
jgi:hypothetical protein